MSYPPSPSGPGGPSASGRAGMQAGPPTSPVPARAAPSGGGRGRPAFSGLPNRRRRVLIYLAGGLLLALPALFASGIAFIVSRPTERQVPAVLGQELTRAKAVLDDEGFEVEVRPTANVATKDRILGQSPNGGAEADEGSTISLTVSAGPGKGLVPDVAELPEPRANAALRAVGFVARARQEFSRGVAAGDAIRTQPAAGARLGKGSRMTLVVSKGPQTVAVPAIVGDPEAGAKRTVKQAGLQIEITQERSNQSPGNVLSQSPRPASVVGLGSVVEVVIDKPPRPVQVPDVEGKPVQGAVSSLSDLGLAVFFRTRGGANGQADKVLRQQPAPGAKAQPGSRVVLLVAGGAPETPAPPAPAGP